MMKPTLKRTDRAQQLVEEARKQMAQANQPMSASESSSSSSFTNADVQGRWESTKPVGVYYEIGPADATGATVKSWSGSVNSLMATDVRSGTFKVSGSTLLIHWGAGQDSELKLTLGKLHDVVLVDGNGNEFEQPPI